MEWYGERGDGVGEDVAETHDGGRVGGDQFRGGFGRHSCGWLGWVVDVGGVGVMCDPKWSSRELYSIRPVESRRSSNAQKSSLS